jgi:hypothetical protein
MADLFSFQSIEGSSQKVSSYFYIFCFLIGSKNSASSSRLMVGLDDTGMGIVFGGGRDASWRFRHSDA